MKLYVAGAGPVVLGKSDFVARGGEGRVYARGDRAFKVWDDPPRCAPAGKLAALAAVDVPGVVAPQAPLLDAAGVVVGYAMPLVRDAWALARLVPEAFRARHGISDSAVIDLLLRLRTAVERIHAHGALVVDLNELNVLVAERLDALYLIDVDSWQIGPYPATALTPAARDWHAPEGHFDTGTDWYAFAVLAFLLLCGVHPYKGKHPDHRGLQARALALLPVFHPDVLAPPAMRPLAAVPAAWRTWLHAVFADGERRPPPCRPGALPVRARPVRAPTGLRLTELDRFDAPVRGLRARLGTTVVWTADALFVDGRRVAALPDGFADVAFSPRRNVPIAASLRDGRLRLLDLHSGAALPLLLRADAVLHTAGRLVVKCGEHLLDLVLHDAGPEVVATTRPVARVLARATALFCGLAVQDLLGSAFVSVFPAPGRHVQVRVPELDGRSVTDAGAERGVVEVVSSLGGAWERLILRIAEDGRRTDVRREPLPGPVAVSLAVLDSGVCVALRGEAGAVDLFAARVGSDGVRRVADPGLRPAWTLHARDGAVVVPDARRLLRVSLG